LAKPRHGVVAEICRGGTTILKGHEKCATCDGEGYIYFNVPHRHGPSRDVGYLEEQKEICAFCSGDGEIPIRKDEE